jgi:hypothetical protein
VSHALLVVGKMSKGIREQETQPIADRYRESQKPGNMIVYSPKQIISRADAAGQAAYAAVIRAGGAAGVAERAYSRAYLGTIPPSGLHCYLPRYSRGVLKEAPAALASTLVVEFRVNPQCGLRRSCGGHRVRGRGAKPHPAGAGSIAVPRSSRSGAPHRVGFGDRRKAQNLPGLLRAAPKKAEIDQDAVLCG